MLGEDRSHLLEVALQPCRHHDLENSSRRVGDVPHGVRDVAWLDDRGAGIDLLVGRAADPRADAPREDQGELVLLRVLMRLDERLWRDRDLQDHQTPIGVRRLEPVAERDSEELDGLLLGHVVNCRKHVSPL